VYHVVIRKVSSFHQTTTYFSTFSIRNIHLWCFIALLQTVSRNFSWRVRPLSGTSSFSNDTVRFTRFFVYNGDRISHFFLGELKFDKQSLPTSCNPLCYSETEKPTLIFTVIVFTISKTCNHCCQCKQMHRNYFRITTALCHLIDPVVTQEDETSMQHSDIETR